MEVCLGQEIVHLELARVVGAKGHGHDQGHETRAVVADDGLQLRLVARVEEFLEIAGDVFEHVGVLGRGRGQGEGAHEHGFVGLAQGVGGPVLRLGREPAELAGHLRAVRHEQQLVGRGEGDEPGGKARAAVAGKGRAPAVEGEDALDEVFPQSVVVQAALFLNGEQGEGVHEGPCEKAGAARDRRALFAVDFHPGHAARRGFCLENEAAEIFASEFAHPAQGPGAHALREVHARFYRHQARGLGIADEAHGLAGNAQAAFHFRAHGHELEELPERFHDVRVALVPAVVAHVLPEQAGAHPHTDRFSHNHPFRGPPGVPIISFSPLPPSRGSGGNHSPRRGPGQRPALLFPSPSALAWRGGTG